MTDRTDEATLLRAISALDEKLTTLINTAVTGLTVSINSIQQRHNEDLIAQAKLNATFATRDRTETVAALVNESRSEHGQINYRIAQLEDRVDAANLAIHDLTDRIANSTTGILRGANGYLVNAIFFGGGAVLTFVLNHTVH